MWTSIQNELGTGFAAQALALLADGGLKGIVLMAFASMAVLAMRRSTASARHLVHLLALGGLFFLPLVSLLVPTWQLPILPAAEVVTPQPAADPDQGLDVDAEAGGRVFLPAAKHPMGQPVHVAPDSAPAPLDSTTDPLMQTGPERAVARMSAPLPDGHNRLAFWGLAIWLTLFLLIIFPLLAGLGVLRRMSRHATPFASDTLPRLTQELAHALELRGPVRLLRAPAGTMPMAAGLFRPVVFLPADAETWSDEKRRAVLLHELAHVKRRDCLTHALAHLAVSLHWFNPFAWLALRRLRIEREHACDDLVLAAGERPAEYAEVLLDVARSLRAGTLTSAAAITMAKKSHLEGRLLAVLDEARKRTRLTRRAALGFALVGALLTAALSTLHVTRAESTVVVDQLTFSSGVEARIASVGQPDGYTVSSVWAPDGAPLPGPPEGFVRKMGGSSSDKSGVKRRFFIEVSPVPEESDLGVKFKVEGSESGAAFNDFFEKEGKAHVVVTHTPREDDFRLVVFDGDDTAYTSRQVSSFGVRDMHQTEFIVEGEHDEASALPWFDGCKPNPDSPDLWVEDFAYVTGDHVAQVTAEPSRTGDDFVVLLRLTEDGAARFFNMTKAGIGRTLAIVINDQVASAPVVVAPINNAIMFQGNFDKATADNIAAAIQGGDRKSDAAPSEHALGPVVEITVHHSDENCLIDFDTGTLHTPPDFDGTEEALAWMAAHGIDAGGGLQEEIRGLIGMDLIVNPESNATWGTVGTDGTLNHDAFEFGKPGNPVYLSAKGKLPATYTFKTREGGVEIVQILGFIDQDPRGVQIRYRMRVSDQSEIETGAARVVDDHAVTSSRLTSMRAVIEKRKV